MQNFLDRLLPDAAPHKQQGYKQELCLMHAHTITLAGATLVLSCLKLRTPYGVKQALRSFQICYIAGRLVDMLAAGGDKQQRQRSPSMTWHTLL